MLEPLSVGAVVCTVAFAISRPGTGYSSESHISGKSAEVFRERIESSQALFGEKGAAIADIQELLEECGKFGWDGDKAAPLNVKSARSAVDFIRALPDEFPMPEFSPEATGNLSLDWISSRHRYLSVTVTPAGRLLYVLADGVNRSRGVASFDNGQIPVTITTAISVAMKDKYASVRLT